MASSSQVSFCKSNAASLLPVPDSNINSSQYSVSAASFSIRLILWMKSAFDSARFASR
jgi:hypothetical protein